jgi:hypothetical protein
MEYGLIIQKRNIISGILEIGSLRLTSQNSAEPSGSVMSLKVAIFLKEFRLNISLMKLSETDIEINCKDSIFS